MTEIDDYVAYLSAAARSETAVLHEFRIQFYGDVTSLHAFFEGEEDPLYYMNYIRKKTGKNVFWYYCGGKQKLNAVRDDVYQMVADCDRVAFFVDRDYDDFLDTQISIDERTYVTDFYSIENCLSGKRALEVLLSDFAGISSLDPERKFIIESFVHARAAFERALMPVVAWLLAVKTASAKLNIQNVDLAKVLSVSYSGVKRKHDGFSYFMRACDAPPSSMKITNIKKWIKILKSKNPDLWLRGKFALWFFKKFLVVLLTNLLKKQGEKKRWKMPKPLSQSLLFEALAPRLPIPESLDRFLGTAFMPITAPSP